MSLEEAVRLVITDLQRLDEHGIPRSLTPKEHFDPVWEAYVSNLLTVIKLRAALAREGR